MKITDVRTAVVEANYDWTFTRVYTDEEGIMGVAGVAQKIPVSDEYLCNRDLCTKIRARKRAGV